MPLLPQPNCQRTSNRGPPHIGDHLAVSSTGVALAGGTHRPTSPSPVQLYSQRNAASSKTINIPTRLRIVKRQNNRFQEFFSALESRGPATVASELYRAGPPRQATLIPIALRPLPELIARLLPLSGTAASTRDCSGPRFLDNGPLTCILAVGDYPTGGPDEQQSAEVSETQCYIV